MTSFLEQLRAGTPRCWIAGLVRAGRLDGEVVGACDGVLIRAHLIPKQRIRTQFPRGAWSVAPGVGSAWPVRREEEEVLADPTVWVRTCDEIVWDRRVWVPMCGGPMGNAGHHGMLDSGGVRRIKVERAWLPVELEEFAEEYGLGWSLEADYGSKETG